MTDKERKKIKKALAAYEVLAVKSRAHGIPVPQNVQDAVALLRAQLEES